MNIFLILLLVAGIIGMVFGLIKGKQGVSWGSKLAVACVVLTVGVIIFSWMMPAGSLQRQVAEFLEKDQQYQHVIGEKVGRMLADEMPGSQILVIADAEKSYKLDGLKNGLAGRATVEAVFPDLENYIRRNFAGQPEQVSSMVEEQRGLPFPSELVDETIKSANMRPDSLVFLCSLPFDYERLSIWRDRRQPDVILASGEDIWNIPDIIRDIENGNITAMVVHKQVSGILRQPIPQDTEEAFSKRYALVTRDNMDSIIERYPNLLMSGF